VRRELAKAYFRASWVNWFIAGADGEGQVQAIQAAQLYREMIAESPGDMALRKELAEAHARLSFVQHFGGQTKASLGNVSRAIELQEQLWAEDPSDVRLARLLAGCYSFRVLLKSALGDPEEATADTRRSVEILQKLLLTGPPEEKDATLLELALAFYRTSELRNCLNSSFHEKPHNM